AELETIVIKALEKNPAERYATAQELADDLRRFLDDRPIRARRATMWQRLRKWGRRHRGAVAGGVVGLAFIAVVSVPAAVFFQQQEAKQRQLATDADTQRGLANERLESERKAHQHLEVERQRAERVSARSQLELGVRLLNDGDSRGLLEIVEACKTAQ